MDQPARNEADRIYADAEAQDEHVANVDGQHDEMEYRTDCPACQPADQLRAAGAAFTPLLDPTTSGHSYVVACPKCGRPVDPARMARHMFDRHKPVQAVRPITVRYCDTYDAATRTCSCTPEVGHVYSAPAPEGGAL